LDESDRGRRGRLSSEGRDRIVAKAVAGGEPS
jgi:hypothetical protein